MKFITVIACILAVAGAVEIFLEDNGEKCLIDCVREEGKIISSNSNCSSFVTCKGRTAITSFCNDGWQFDDELKDCVQPEEGDRRICHPCAEYPLYVDNQQQSNCPVTCGPNEIKNVSHSVDCSVYVECRNQNHIKFLDCPDGYKFIDDAQACIQPAEVSGPTCHPCFV